MPTCSSSTASARTALSAGDSPVIGDTLPTGPRRIASVVTPNVTAIRAERPSAGGRAERGAGRRREPARRSEARPPRTEGRTVGSRARPGPSWRRPVAPTRQRGPQAQGSAKRARVCHSAEPAARFGGPITVGRSIGRVSATLGGLWGPTCVTDPAQIPHDVEERPVATQDEQNPKQQVSGCFPRKPQVTDLAPVTLSRWRHGFEPRWDYRIAQLVRPDGGMSRPTR